MSRESLPALAMRFYTAWRRTLFALLALLFLTSFHYLSVNGYFEGAEVGGWLRNLFAYRGVQNRPLAVEIIGFDKSADASNYAALLDSTPELRLITGAKGTAFDRAVYAATLDKLVAAGARMVVFDFVFEGPGPSAEGDRAFAAALARHRDKVVVGFDFTYTERPKATGGLAEKIACYREPLEDLLPEEKPESILGFVSVWPDANGAITHMVAREDRLSLTKPEMAAKLKGFEDLSLTARAVSKLGIDTPADNAARMIRFEGPDRTFRITLVQDLFTPDRWAGDLGHGDRFKDKVVVVGPYSELHYKDKFPTPFGSMFGVEIQANCLLNYLEQGWIRRPLEGNTPTLLAAGMIGLVWIANGVIRTRRTSLRTAIAFLPLLGYLGAAFLVFDRSGIFLPATPAYFAAALGITCLVFDFIQAQYDRSRIKGMFGTYLSPAIVNRMIASGEEPKLGGEQVELTAFFSDVQSFSSFSEILTPEQLVEIMNAYLGAMTEILEADAGTLDKYIGDAIVAMFGAPIPLRDHAHQACACALQMQKRLAALRAEWAAMGDKWPKKIHAMRMRIGLNTGPATVGNMGSAKRFNYTMMGDTVNLAARCESGAKSAGVYILVSGETMEAARRSAGRPILFRRIDRWKVKGRSAPVLMVEVTDFLDEASADTRECVRLYEQALDLYFTRDFAAAKTLFERARALEPLQPGRDAGVEHTPSEIMSERCDEMLAEPPPANWDGVYVMKSK